MQPGGFAEIDTKTPSGARVYDYMLGGTDHYACDRVAADQAELMMPGTKALARNNRRYMERVVAYLAGECGIRQFIDNGSGLPTSNNVHHIAQAIAPESRVVYVDIDPVVLRHQRVGALAENGNTAFVLADATDVEAILSHPETRRLVRPGEPAATLYMTFLHFIPDTADPGGMIRKMMGHLAQGSYLAVSQIVSDDPAIRERMTEFALASTKGNFGRFRSKQEVSAFFDGLDVAEPGLVDVNDWHPDGREEPQSTAWIEFGGVARKAG
jgi:hypothetical protein